MRKLFLSISLIISLSLGTVSHVAFADDTSVQSRKAGEYLTSRQTEDGNTGGPGFTGWAIQGLAATGQETSRATNYLIGTLNGIEDSSATDIERTILAVIAGGQDPYNVGGKNLVAILESKASEGQIGSPALLNDDLFGILALLASNVPSSNSALQDAVRFVSERQQGNGSWSWSATSGGDSNNTAIAVQALMLAKQRGVASDWDRQRAVEFLKKTQNNNGGFGYTPDQASDAASTSWVVGAIMALGQQTETWRKDGKHAYDYLTSLQQENGGVKWQMSEPEPDILTSAYAAIAFARKAFPVATFIAPSPTPSPSPAPTPSPSAIASPTPSPVASPSSAPSPRVSPTPRVTPSASPSPRVSPSPSPLASPSPRPSVTPRATPSARVSPRSTPSPQLSPSPSPSVSTVPSPSPSPSAASSPSPSPQESPTPTTQSPSPTPSPSAQSRLRQVEVSEEEDVEVSVEEGATVVSTPKSVLRLPRRSAVSNGSLSPTSSPTVRPTASPSDEGLEMSDEETEEAEILGVSDEDDGPTQGGLVGAGLLIFAGILLVAWGGTRSWIGRRL